MAGSYAFKQYHLLIFSLVFFRSHLSAFSNASSTGNSAAGSGGGIYGGRHSYSLTTFDPSGNLDQVVRAMRASMLGVPIVALSIPSIASSSSLLSGATTDVDVSSESTLISTQSISTTDSRLLSNSISCNPIPNDGGMYFCMPLRFLTTSPLVIDDGTPRVVPVTSSICILHTGVGADGRSLCDTAITMALDYKYLYGEEISAEELLEGIAEKVQEMTMRGGARPFGCALLVGCLGRDSGSKGPTMYRVDPSGAVELLASFNNDKTSETATSENSKKGNIERKGLAAILGNWGSLGREIGAIRNRVESESFSDEGDIQAALTNIARETFATDDFMMKAENGMEKTLMNKPVLFASFTRDRGLQIIRITS